MKITELIAQHILDVHQGNNWTEVDITGTLKDVTWQQAATLTQASPNTIATLLHHLSYWNRVMVQRVNGIKVEVPESNGYEMPPLQTVCDWEKLKEDNLQSAHELAEAIRDFNETKLEQPILPGSSSSYKNLQGSVEHIHYHLGQMVILKKLVKSMYTDQAS